jgi:hypothetical protein
MHLQRDTKGELLTPNALRSEQGGPLDPQYSNIISDVLLTARPFVFYFFCLQLYFVYVSASLATLTRVRYHGHRAHSHSQVRKYAK